MRKSFYFFCLLFSNAVVYGQQKSMYVKDEILVLSDSNCTYNITPKVSFFQDINNYFSILNVHHNKFIKNFKKDLNFGTNTSTIWIKFKLLSNLKNNKDWILFFDNPMIDSIYLYQSKTFSEYKIIGDLVPFYTREVKNQKIAIPITIVENDTISYFLKIKDFGSTVFSLQISTKDKFYKDDSSFNLVSGIFIGIILAMIVYNLFIFITLKDINFGDSGEFLYLQKQLKNGRNTWSIVLLCASIGSFG
jgi:hypothetical protein